MTPDVKGHKLVLLLAFLNMLDYGVVTRNHWSVNDINSFTNCQGEMKNKEKNSRTTALENWSTFVLNQC